MVGVESLIKIAMPVLLIGYPVAISLIMLWVFYDLLPNDGVFSGAVYVTTVVSAIDALDTLGVNLGFLSRIVSKFPLANYGFAWIIPAILGGLIGAIIFRSKHSETVKVGK